VPLGISFLESLSATAIAALPLGLSACETLQKRYALAFS
jgi:hypothetical protein